MPSRELPSLDELRGVSVLQHIFHDADHPLYYLADTKLVEFNDAVEWHRRIHREAIEEHYDLGHIHGDIDV